MNTTAADLTWQSEAQSVLDSYLCKIGIESSEIRSRWVAHVLSALQAQIGKYAADDIVEQAVERLRNAIDARLAKIADLDPVRERREIAGVLVVLQKEKNADLLHTLFADCDGPIDSQMREQLFSTVIPELPRPVRADARVDMPVQAIELRSINPLRRLVRAFR